MEQPACQTNQLIARSDYIETSGATAQGDQFNRQPELIEIEKTEERIAQTDGGEHGIVPAKAAMSSNMNETAFWSFATQDVCTGVLAQEQLRVLENMVEG